MFLKNGNGINFNKIVLGRKIVSTEFINLEKLILENGYGTKIFCYRFHFLYLF
jgi:hypothetical protein